MAKEEIILTDDQKKLIVNRWNDATKEPPGQKELIELCFGLGFDGRSAQGIAVKKYCATLGFKPKSSFEYEAIKVNPLTEEQKLFISNHASTMSCTELTREIYNNQKLNNLSKEYKVIAEYLKTIPDIVLYQDLSRTATSDDKYRPPKTLSEAATRVNKYTQNCIKPEETQKDQKVIHNLGCLIRHCHNPRYQLKMNSLNSLIHRSLFEQGYVRFLYDKGDDITEEEIDAYINLCDLIVEEQKMTEEIEKLTSAMDEMLKETDNKKINMSIVDSIDNIRDKLSQNRKMQNELRNTLQGKRSERMANKIKENASVIQLIDAWRDEEKRTMLLKLAQRQKEAVKDELKRQEAFDDVISQIYGIDKMAFE